MCLFPSYESGHGEHSRTYSFPKACIRVELKDFLFSFFATWHSLTKKTEQSGLKAGPSKLYFCPPVFVIVLKATIHVH